MATSDGLTEDLSSNSPPTGGVTSEEVQPDLTADFQKNVFTHNTIDSYLVGHPFVVGHFSWNTNQVEGTVLHSLKLHPSNFPPELRALVMMYEYWTGSVDVVLTIPGTGLHGGKLMVYSMPPGRPIEEGVIEQSIYPWISLDAKEQSSLAFQVQDQCRVKWHQTSTFEEEDYGRTIVMTVLSKLIATTPQASDVRVVVSFAIRSDFRVSTLKPMPFTKPVATAFLRDFDFSDALDRLHPMIDFELNEIRVSPNTTAGAEFADTTVNFKGINPKQNHQSYRDAQLHGALWIDRGEETGYARIHKESVPDKAEGDQYRIFFVGLKMVRSNGAGDTDISFNHPVGGAQLTINVPGSERAALLSIDAPRHGNWGAIPDGPVAINDAGESMVYFSFTDDHEAQGVALPFLVSEAILNGAFESLPDDVSVVWDVKHKVTGAQYGKIRLWPSGFFTTGRVATWTVIPLENLRFTNPVTWPIRSALPFNDSGAQAALANMQLAQAQRQIKDLEQRVNALAIAVDDGE
ncbi:hypothetical protein 2 [Beihai picorna-like virus 119]|uniref:hypothetical protein 2 n=1 Tax=Beihai picorna-like virus 119 TaxID=1922548 RepID=UPI00090B8B64|nr:hypothetical protein 2 [Beihai picorna-like virus 119]APG76818.1 hypothetical protein 2 [Beihai picorna-like virus 119]